LTSSLQTVETDAPAKLNLFLEVIGKRSDGYHDVETVAHEIDLADKLTFSPAQELSLNVTGLPIPPGGENLVLRAARILQEMAGTKYGAAITLHKNIPAGSGLGGGSSDAAATLKALNSLWKLKMRQEDLLGIASRLGSDVPFFIHGKTALCTGRGQIVSPLTNRNRLIFLLVMPALSVSTAEIYKNLSLDLTCGRKDATLLIEGLARRDVTAVGRELFNRLEFVTVRLYPELEHVRRRLEELSPAGLAMTGSGSAFYCLARTRSEAEGFLQKSGLKAIIVSSII